MRLALYQPDMAPNLGAAMRLCACLGVPLDVIEPCGFPLGDSGLRRAAMDYAGLVEARRHVSWERFLKDLRVEGRRLILLTTRGAVPHLAHGFTARDTLLLGRESAGVPQEVHDCADARVVIPMAAAARSLNVVNAGAIVLGEALRQTGAFPSPTQT